MIKQIGVKDFLNNHVLTNLKANNTETFCLFFSNKPNLINDTYDKVLYKISLNTYDINKIDLDWVPDDYYICNEQVYFKKLSLNETQIYEFNFRSNSTTLVKTIPFRVKELFIFDNSIYFTADINSTIKRINSYDSEFEVPRYKNNVAKNITYLFKSYLGTNTLILLSEKELDIDKVHFDFSNNLIMYSAFSIKDIKSIASDIYTYDLTNNQTTKWTNGNYRIGYISSISKENMLFMGIDLRENSRNTNQDHLIINKSTKRLKSLTEYSDKSNEHPGVMTDSCFSTSSPVFTKSGSFYHITVDRFKETLRSIDETGQSTVYDCDLKTIDSFIPLKDGILFIGLRGLNLHEIYLLKNKSLMKITSFNDWTKEYELSTPIYVKDSVDGWVIPPIGFESNKSYPGILMIHGGPKNIYTDVIAHDMQLLASKGYFIFYCNPRGSDGRGNEFANIRGNFSKYAYEDLMNFVDKVLAIYPQIDCNRLGVTGGSYGGYMTNYIITSTDRFKAAVSERGISDMKTAFLSSDIGFYYAFEYMGNSDTPWTNQTSYNEASPLSNAHKVKTPTLFNHGLTDIRCHYLESLNMYNAILYHGVKTRINLFEDESHRFVVTGKPSSRLKRYNELLGWFNIFLKEEQ